MKKFVGMVAFAVLAAGISACSNGGSGGPAPEVRSYDLDAGKEVRRAAGLIRATLAGPYAAIPAALKYDLVSAAPGTPQPCPAGGTWSVEREPGSTGSGPFNATILMEDCSFSGAIANGSLSYTGLTGGNSQWEFDRFVGQYIVEQSGDFVQSALEFDIEVKDGAFDGRGLAATPVHAKLLNGDSAYLMSSLQNLFYDFENGRLPIGFAKGVAVSEDGYYGATTSVWPQKDMQWSFETSADFPLLVFNLPVNMDLQTQYGLGGINAYVEGTLVDADGNGQADYESTYYDDQGAGDTTADSVGFTWVEAYNNALFSVDP